jgi:hypothetical protein
MAGSMRRGALLLALPFAGFLFVTGSLALAVRHLYGRWRPAGGVAERVAAGAVLGAAFALDPQAQHFSVGSFAELPFAVGLLFAVLGLALGAAAEVPFVYGVMLGGAALFRGDFVALVPVFAAAAAWVAADPSRSHDHRPPRVRAFTTLVFVLGGCALVLAPWWAFKLREFGTPLWSPTTLLAWDGVEGRSAFSILHVAEWPALPPGAETPARIAVKAARELPPLLLGLLTGPRAMWIAALVLWLALVRPPRPLAAAGACALVALGAALAAGAAGLAWPRDAFAARVVVESAGLLATWALVAHYTGDATRRLRHAWWALAAVLALGWGAWRTANGAQQARAMSAQRTAPAPASMMLANKLLSDSTAAGTPVMSNLGAMFAWYSNRPVIRLADTPEDVPVCRQRFDVRHVLLAFREPPQAWAAWTDVLDREGAASGTPGLLARRERRWVTPDGWQWVWLELPVRGPALASAPARRPSAEVAAAPR